MHEHPREPQKRPGRDTEKSEFLDSLRKGLLLGVVLLVLVVPPIRMARDRAAQPPAQVATAPQPRQPQMPPPQVPPQAGGAPAPALRLADFAGEEASPDARLVANWVAATGDNQRHSFVLVDKKDARVYVFAPDGRLKESAPALLGAARGDDSFPGIGEKPLAAVRPEEKTTPAGRYVAEPGMNTHNEDIVWVDYDVAVSMHRIRPLVASERRLERLATPSTDDNRISFGCINLPVSFYENVVSPTVRQTGAIIYVLPEVKTPQEVFGAYDVTDPILAAANIHRSKDGPRKDVQKVALQAR